MQEKLDPSRSETRVLNLGVPGYALRELPELLKDN